MTAYELLWMYARLRGIPERKIKDVVEMEIERLDILKHAKNFCGTYRYVPTNVMFIAIIFYNIVEETSVN